MEIAFQEIRFALHHLDLSNIMNHKSLAMHKGI